MANQSKLKAWVRYDGTGRVISGGPIFQTSKPKVGNWRQIDANLCCNGGLTTTTTTTSRGGGVTPTAWIASVWAGYLNACTNPPGATGIVYTQTSTVGIGTTLWADSALTIPYTPGPSYSYIKLSGDPGLYVFTQMMTTSITNTDAC